MRLHIVSGWRLALVGAAAIIGAICVAAALMLTVKFGREMAGYLENSTGLAMDGVTTAASPAEVAPAPPLPVEETPVSSGNEDAAELRTTTAIEPEQ